MSPSKLNTVLYVLVALAISLGCNANFCDNNQFACADGKQCIALSKQCDCKYDCRDKSDEQNCRYNSSNWAEFDQTYFTITDFEDYGFRLICEEQKFYLMADGLNTAYKIMVQKKVDQKFSKNCVLNMTVENSGKMGNDPMNVHIKMGDQKDRSWESDEWKTTTLFPLGYHRANTTVKISAEAWGGDQYGILNWLKVSSFVLIDCDPSKIALDCTFKENRCKWLPTDRFPMWELKEDRLLHNGSDIVEIRSPLLLANSYCLTFIYRIDTTDDFLKVTKINLDGNLAEEVIWSANVPTTDHSITERLNLTNYNDFDIGFLSSAPGGQVYLFDVTIKTGFC